MIQSFSQPWALCPFCVHSSSLSEPKEPSPRAVLQGASMEPGLGLLVWLFGLGGTA